MVRKRKRLGEGSDDGKGGGSDNGKSGGSSSKKLGELDMTSDIVDEGLWVKGVDEGGGRGGGHGGVGETYSSSTVVEGFINGMWSCGKPLIMGEERVKESTRKLLVYLCEFVEGVKVEEASDDVLKALPGLLAWAKEICLSVRGGGGYGAPTKGGGMSENSPKNLSSPRNQKLSSPLSCSLKETSMRYFDEDDTKYRDDVLSAALRFATACLGVMTIAPGQYACKEGGDSGMVLAPLSLHAWDGLQAVVVVEAAAGIAAAPPQLNCHFQWARGDGGGNSSPTTTLPPKQLKCQLWDYHELDFWKMPHFKMKDATIHLPDYMVHELQSLAAEYFVTAAQQHAPSLRPPRLSSPLAPFRVSSPRSPSCGGRDDDGSDVIKGVHGITSLCPSNSVGACILRWACRVCGIIQVITKDDCSPKAETVPSGVVGVAHCQPLLFLSAVRRLLFVVRKGIEAAKRHHDILPVSQADKLEVWKLSTELMDSLLMATEGLIQSVECRSHHTSVSSTSKAVGACSPTSNSPPSTLSELCMALSRTLNVIEGGAAVSIENIVPEALDDIKFLAVSHEPSTILAGEQCAALSIYCAARIIACLPGKEAFANMLKQLGLEASPNITSSGEKTSSQVQKVKEGRYMPPITLYGQILSTSLRTLSDLLKMSLRNEGGGDMGMSNVQRNELLDDMSRAGRKCFLVSPAMRLGLFLEEFMNSIQERGRRASWCCNYGDDSVGDYNIGHFENYCKDVMAVPRAVADRLILTLVASMASERISCEALTRRGIGIRAGHVSSLFPFGTATLKLWSSDGSVARQVIAILHFFLRAASATECQINHLSTDQCKGMEDDEPPSTARLHTKHVRLVKAVNLAENEGDSLMPEAMEECGGEGTTLPTSHPLVVNQTTHKQFALLFTAALEEDHFAALAYVWRACECWNLHETSRLSLSSSPHHTSPTPGRIYPKQPSAALSWMRIYWVAWEGLLQCLETCCSTQWEPQTFQFLNGNGDAVYLVRTLLEKLPLRAMAGTLRSSSGGNADVTTNKESLHHNKFSSVSLPFTLSVSDMSLLRKCLGGVLARVVGEGGSAQVEGIFPPELLVAPWDRLLEHCTSGVKIGRGFGGCVSVLHTQLLASCYVAMESKERKEVTTRAFSACHTLIKDFFDLQSTNGASSSGTVVEFEDMSLNAVRWLPSTGDGLNLVSNSLSPISALLGHVLFLLCFVCGKLTNGDSETLQGGGGEGKQDKTVSLNRLLPPAPNLGGFNGNVASREVPPSCYSVTELVNNVVNCADDAIERPPRPWERIGHAKKVCLGNVVDVYEMRTLLLNVLSSAVILAQPQIFHGPNIPVGLNAISSRAEAEKRCIEGCFLFFAAWKLLAYLPSEDLISLTDSMRSPAVQEVTAIRPGEGRPEAKTMSALWIASYARSVLMLLPSPESEFSSSHEKGGYDKVCSQLGSPYFDGLLQAASTIDLREISNTFQERLRWSSFNGAELEEFPNGIFCDDVNLMGGCEEAGRRGCESSEVEDSNETMIDSSSALNPTSEGDTRGGVYHGIRQNWEGGENDGSTLATSISRRREAHASLQAVGVCVQAACASAQSEARELKEAGLSFSSDRTDSVVGALSHCTSLFERCLEHFLFILKGGLMELYMIEKDWNSQNDVKAAENAIEVLMLIEWPDIKEAAVMLDLPVEHLEVLRDTITAPPLSRVQLGSDFQRSLSLRTASSSAHFSPSSTACMEPERVALARGSASQCMWEYVLNICIAIELFPNAGTTIPISPTTSQQKERGERAPFLSSPMFAAILEECTSVKNVLLEVFDGLLAILSLTQTVIGNEKPNGLSVDLANAILLANESLAHPWLSALRLRWMNTITEMQGGDDRLAGEVADVWKIHSAGHVLSILVQQPSGLDGQGAMKAALHAIALLRTLVQRKGPRILQEYYLSGIETPEGVCRRPQTWEYRLLDMFSAEVSDAVPSLVPIPDVCDLLHFIATVPEHSKDAMGLLKNLVCKDDGLEDSEWDNEWPVLISPLVNLLVSWTKDELRYVLFTQLDQNPNQNPNQKPLSQQSKQSLFKSPPQCDKSSQAKEFIAILCSLLGWRHDDGLVKDGAVEKRTDLDVEEDLSSVPPLSELAEAEEGKDTTGGGPALAFDEESEKDGSRSVATLSSEEARQRRKRRRSFPDRPPHHSAPFRPAHISRKPFNDMDDKIGFTTKPCGSYVVPGCNKLRHRVLDVLIHISHSWLSMDETHCSNGISNLAVWLASKCDKLPRLLSVLVEVGLKMANPEDAGFPRVQPFEGTSCSHTVRLRSILKCVSLAKHLLDSLSRLGKTNKQSGSDMETLQLKATLDDLELVPQLCTYNDGVTESFEANRNTKGIAAASEPTTGANRCDETPIKSEEEKRTCTYVESSGDFVEQHWYNCFTCGLVGEKGCCSVCIKVCHAGHSVSYSRFSSYFCDCGAGEGPSKESRDGSMAFHPCKCLNPIIPEVKAEKKDQWLASSAPHEVTAEQTNEKGESVRSAALALKEMSSSSGVTPQCGQVDDLDLQGRHPQQQSSALLPAVWSKSSQNSLYNDMNWLKGICLLLRELLTLVFGEIRSAVQITDDTTTPYLTPSDHPLRIKALALGGGQSTDLEGSAPHQLPSICAGAKKLLLCPFWCAKQGTFNVASQVGNSQEQQNHIMSGRRVIKRCIDADSRGRIAITENKHVLIVDLTNFLMGPERKGKGQTSSSFTESLPVSAMADRSYIGTLNNTDVGFDVIGLAFNPENEQHLAVWGMSRVVVLTGQNKASVLGEPRSQLKIDLSFGMGVDSSTSILKAMWVPNSQVLLVVVCVQFVRVYDLSKDVTIPIHTLFLPATSSEDKESRTLICDSVLLPPPPECGSSTSLHHSFSGRISSDATTPRTTTSNLAATVLILTNHGKLFSKGIPKPTQDVLEEGVQWRSDSSSSPRSPSPKSFSNQDCEIRHQVIIPSHVLLNGLHHPSKEASLYYSAPTGMLFYCTNSTFVLALAMSGAGDECEVVGGLPCSLIPDEQLGQDGSGSEDLSQKGHQPPPQSIGCVYASFAHSSLFNSKTSGGWNSWSWNTQANATAGSWDKEESTGVVNDRSTLLLCTTSTDDSNKCGGLALSLGAKKEKGEGVEIATQTLSWGSSPYTEMPTQPSVDTSSSGELLFKEATFFSPEDAKGMGEVQGMCVCPAFHGRNFAQDGGITERGSSAPLGYPLSVLVLYGSGGLQCFRMVNDECKKQWRSVDASGGLRPTHDLVKPTEDDRNSKCLKGHPSSHDIFDPKQPSSLSHRQGLDLGSSVEGEGEEESFQAISSGSTSWPVDVFEHLHRVTTDPRLYLGSDVAGGYTPNQILSKLYNGDDGNYIMMPRLCGGSVSLHLKHPSMQIAAVRVQVGTTSCGHRPQVIRVMGKAVPVLADHRQWYDFILSYDDMLHCEHMGALTVSVSSTKESGHHTAITGLDVFATERPATPSCTPTIAKVALPIMGSGGQVGLVGVESVASAVVAGNECGKKINFVQSALEVCMELVVEAVSVVSTRSIVSERSREVAGRGNGNDQDGDEQSSLSQLQNMALDTLSHTVLMSNVSKWMAVRKLCRSIIFYVNENSEQNNVLIEDWKNTSLGMIDAAQLKAVHGILLSPQLPMKQLRQCIRFCALVCRDRPDHRNPAIDTALCVSAFFRARWNCDGSTTELAGVLRDIMRCICLETECRRIDNDKRKGTKMFVTDMKGHSDTETEVVGSPDDNQIAILTGAVHQLLLLLCGPSARLSCLATDQLVDILIPPSRSSQLKTLKALTTAQKTTPSRTVAMQQCTIQKEHNNCSEEFSAQLGREETACSDSDVSVANGNDVAATGAEKLGDVDEFEGVPRAMEGIVGSRLASFMEDLGGIARNSDAMNDGLGMDINEEGYQGLDYRCDGCNYFPLEGTRHHCTECADFDLCHTCFDRIHVQGTSPPPVDSGHNRLHRVIAQVIHPSPSTSHSRAVIQGNSGDSDGMEVKLDASVAIASPTAQGGVLAAGNTKIEPDQTTTQPPKNDPMDLCEREEEPPLLERRLLYSLSELLFPIFVDKLPTLISIGRAGKQKQSNLASYLCLLVKLSEQLPSICTATLIGVLEQELIRISSDLAKAIKGSDAQNVTSHSCCVDSYAFCIYAKTMSHLCSLAKGKSSKRRANQAKDHKVTEQKPQQHRFTDPSTWNSMEGKLSLLLCELLRSILANYYDPVEFGRVPLSGHHTGASVKRYGRDGTPISPEVAKIEMMTSPSFLLGSADELLIPISKYSVFSYEDQPNGDTNTLLGCPYTCGMSLHHMEESSGCLYPSSPALRETLHGIRGHKIGVTDNSNNKDQETRARRSGRNTLSPDPPSASPKYSWHMSIMASLLKLGYAMTASSKQNLPCKKFKWGKEWALQLCKVIGNRDLNLLHRSAKYLLSKLCGSHIMSQHFRDEHLFATEMRQLLDALSPVVQQQHPPGHLHDEKSCEDVRYSFRVAAKISLDVLLKTAKERPKHWQSFCSLSKIPSLDDSWPLSLFTSKQGQSVANCTLASEACDMVEGGGKISSQIMDFESGKDTSSKSPVRALLSLLWLASVPDSLKVGILDLLEKATASLPASTSAPLPIPLLGSTGETTTETQSEDHIKGRRERRTLRKVAVQASESLPALFLLTEGPDPQTLLIRMAKELVLSCPSRRIRQRAANLVFYLWRTIPESSQGELVRALAKDVPESTLFGLRSREWLQLMRNITSLLQVGRAEHQKVVRELTYALYKTLIVCKCAIVNHPNAAIYETTETLLNTSDCYLDQLPCPYCPEFTTITEKGKFSSDLPQSHQSSDGRKVESRQERGGRKKKESPAIRCEGEEGRATRVQKGGKLSVPMQSLDSIRVASRTSESAVIVELAGSYCIEQLDVRVSDAHGRLVKTINIYHHAPAVASIHDLRLPNNAHKWQRCAIMCLGPNDTSATVELPLPLQTRALMFEFASFHHDVPPQGGRGGSSCKESIGMGSNDGIGWGGIQCPRCGCTVIDHHGVCQQCNEVAVQCNRCRHINYEHLDAFLCVECGYCAYGTFNWRVAAKPVVSVTHVSSRADREDVLQALMAADIKARGYQESIISLRSEIQQLVMTLGQVGGSRVPGTSSLMPCNAEYGELVEEMMKDAKNNATMTTAIGGPANNFAVTPFLRSLFVGAFPDDMTLDGTMVETIESDKAGEDMMIDYDGGDEEEDAEAEVEGERGGGNCDSSSQLVAGERTTGMGRGGGSVAKRARNLVVKENRRRGGVHAEARDPCEAIDALDHILSLSLSQGQYLGNGGGGGGELGLSFDDCIHVTRNRQGSSPDFVNAAVAAISRRGDIGFPHVYRTLPTYRNPEGRDYNYRNHRRAGGGLADSERAEVGEKGDLGSAAADPVLNQDPCAQNGIVRDNNAACNQSSSSSRNVSNGTAPAVESLSKLYCGAGRYLAIHLREMCETILALRKSLHHYQLQIPPQPYRQRHYLENVQDRPFISITEKRKNGDGTCYPCNREVTIQLLLTLSSLYLRGFEGQGTVLEDLLLSLLNEGIQIGSSSCRAAARQCIVSILKGSPKRACDVVLKYLEGRFNLALNLFPTGSEVCSYLGDEWLLFRDLLLGPKTLVGYQEEQQQQPKEEDSTSSSSSSSKTEIKESKVAGKGGLKRKAKGALLQADVTSTGPAVGAAASQESWIASELLAPFLFSLQPKQLNAQREILISILFSILTRATEGNSKAMITHVALPTLSILANVCLEEESRGGDLYTSSRLSKEALDASSGAVWVIEDTCWKSSGYNSSPLWITISQARRCNLAKKYSLRWLQRVGWLGRPGKSSAFFNRHRIASCDVAEPLSYLKYASSLPKHFLWSMLVTPHSAQARTLSGLLLLHLVQGGCADHIDMLESAMHVFSVMPLVGVEEEALPCLALASALWQTPSSTAYMAARGLIPAMLQLLIREVDWLQKQEVEWAYSYPVGGGPVGSQCHVRSGDLLLRCAEVLSTFYSSCSAYGFSWASPTPLKLKDATSILQVALKIEGLVMVRTASTTRAAAVCRRILIPFDAVGHVRAGIRALQECTLTSSSAEWNSAPEFTLPISSVHSHLQKLADIVAPPTQVPCFPVFMRREPSHDVYFRGSLTCNPFLSTSIPSLQEREEMLSSSQGHIRVGGQNGHGDPTMDDLRHRIARELDMADAAELLELLVCDFIISPTIPLRLVFEKVWKPHVLENHEDCDSETEDSHEPEDLHPMTITYRLGGVDGEATEDKIDSLDDNDAGMVEAEIKERKAMTTAIGEEGGLPLLLCLLRLCSSAEQSVRRSVGMVSAASSTNDGEDQIHHSVQDMVMHHEYRDIVALALRLLKHCCEIRDNRRKLLKMQAPGILLHHTVEVLRGTGSRQARQFTLDSLLLVIEALAQELTEPNSPSCATITSSDNVSTSFDVMVESSEGEKKSEQSVEPGNGIGAATIELNTTSRIDEQQHTEENERYKKGNNTIVMGEPKVNEVGQGRNPLQTDEKSTIKLGNGDNPKAEVFEGDSYGSSSQGLKPEEEAMGVDEDVEGQHLHFLLDALKEESMAQVLRDAPALMRSVSHLLPFLTYAKPKAIQALADQFDHIVTWEEEQDENSEREEEVVTQSDKEISDSTTNVKSGEDGANEEAKAVRDIRRKCFEEALDTMACDRAGDAIRSTLIDTGFLLHCCHFVLHGLPLSDAPLADWKPYCCRGKLDRALRVLTGLARAHKPSQGVLFEAGLLSAMHRLERTPASISGEVGLLAETLLESMAENNSSITSTLSGLRVKERALKHAQASAQRDKALLAMRLPGMGTTPGSLDGTDGSIRDENLPALPASGGLPAWMEEMNELEEETGLTCMVCREGYGCNPREILGAYVNVRVVEGSKLSQLEGHSLVQEPQKVQFEEYLRQVSQQIEPYNRRNLRQRLIEEVNIAEPNSRSLQSASSDFGGKQKEPGSLLISSTSAFNVLHFSCHRKATSTEKKLSNPKSEWEGAALRNSRMACNSMLPIRNPLLTEEPRLSGLDPVTFSWAQCLDKHFSNIREVMQSEIYRSGRSGSCTDYAVGRLGLVLHDIRLLLIQLCYQENLSSTIGGGSLGNNIKLFWYMLQLAGNVCKTSGAETQKCKMLLQPPEAQEGFGGAATSTVTLEIEPSSLPSETLALRAVSAPFRLVLSILLDDVNAWTARKGYLACDMIRLVGMRRPSGLEGCGTGVKPRKRLMSQVGGRDVGVKRKRCCSIDTNEVFNIEKSYLESVKPAVVLLGLVNKIQSLWPGSADGLLNEDDDSFVSLSEAMQQHLEHLTMDISANDCETLVKEIGCEKFVDDSSLSAKDWLTKFVKEGERLASLSDFETV